MNKLALVLLALVFGFVTTTASNTLYAKGKPTTGSWVGTLVDKHCGMDMSSEKAAQHEKACAMKCAKNGKDLGMVVDGKWYAFDAKGQKMAWNILKSSTASSNIQVNVDGKLTGHKITVTKMTPKA